MLEDEVIRQSYTCHTQPLGVGFGAKRVRPPSVIGETGKLALALTHHWNADRLFVIITTYIDEAGTHAGAPLMTIGGYVGRLGQWNRLDRRWPSLCRKHGLDYVHAKEVKDPSGQCQGWTHKQQDALVIDVMRLANAHTLFGFSTRMDHDAYKRVYRSAERPRKVRVDTPYAVCFRYSVSFVADYLIRSLGRTDLELYFVLEDGAKGIGDALRVFREMKNGDHPEIAKLLKTATPADKKEWAGLQLADVIASSAFRHEQRDDRLVHEMPKGTLLSSARRMAKASSPVFRLHVNEDALAELRDHGLALNAARMAFGQSRS